jgi:hypothetical protein
MPQKPRGGAHPLPKISEEMKEWSAALGAELSSWPQTVTKPMFGMTAFYRADRIFAVLPKTRAFETSKGVAFRFEEIPDELAARLNSDSRVIANPIGKKWITFEVNEARDLNAAIEWLSMAYEGCQRKKLGFKSKKQSGKVKSKRSR